MPKIDMAFHCSTNFYSSPPSYKLNLNLSAWPSFSIIKHTYGIAVILICEIMFVPRQLPPPLQSLKLLRPLVHTWPSGNVSYINGHFYNSLPVWLSTLSALSPPTIKLAKYHAHCPSSCPSSLTPHLYPYMWSTLRVFLSHPSCHFSLASVNTHEWGRCTHYI